MSDIEKVAAMFRRHQDEIKLAEGRRDLKALNMLSNRFPGLDHVISRADNDCLYLFPTADQIASLAEHDVVVLIRHGVLYDENEQCLFMIV